MPHDDAPQVELSFVDTDALVNELLGRYDHAIFTGLRFPKDEEYVLHRRWKGNSATCIGLVGLLNNAVTNHFEEEADWRDEYPPRELGSDE